MSSKTDAPARRFQAKVSRKSKAEVPRWRRLLLQKLAGTRIGTQRDAEPIDGSQIDGSNNKNNVKKEEKMNKTQQQLTLIENKLKDFDRKDYLNEAEADLRRELIETAHDLRRQLPQAALTVPRDSGKVLSNPNTGFSGFGDFLKSVRTAAIPGGQVDPRLYNAAPTGLGETINSDGGFLLQPEFSSQLLTSVFQTALLAPRCQRIPVGSSSIPWLSMQSTRQAARPEADGAASRPTF